MNDNLDDQVRKILANAKAGAPRQHFDDITFEVCGLFANNIDMCTRMVLPSILATSASAFPDNDERAAHIVEALIVGVAMGALRQWHIVTNKESLTEDLIRQSAIAWATRFEVSLRVALLSSTVKPNVDHTKELALPLYEWFLAHKSRPDS